MSRPKDPNRTCPYLEARGWHMFVAYRRPDGGTGYCCHACGEYPGTVDTTPETDYAGTNTNREDTP